MHEADLRAGGKRQNERGQSRGGKVPEEMCAAYDPVRIAL